jgi:hypothetical protein
MSLTPISLLRTAASSASPEDERLITSAAGILRG